MGKTLIDYLPEFIKELTEQLNEDEKRWGNTWKKRPIKGQGERTKAAFTNYFDMNENAGIPIPWLKIAGGALICWVREKHPDTYKD